MLTHTQATDKPTAEDYLAIEKEHERLSKFLDDFLNVCTCRSLEKSIDCTQCENEQEASCQGRLSSFLFNAIEITSAHFDHEEKILLSKPHVTKDFTHFRLHRQAHEEFLQKLHALVEEHFSQKNLESTADVYRQLHKKLSDMFLEHDQLFDSPFLQSIQS